MSTTPFVIDTLNISLNVKILTKYAQSVKSLFSNISNGISNLFAKSEHEDNHLFLNGIYNLKKSTNRFLGIFSVTPKAIAMLLVITLISFNKVGAQIGTLNAWTNIYHSATLPATVGTTFSVGAGSNRMLVVALSYEASGSGALTATSVTYGGVAMTAASGNDAATSLSMHALIYYLKDNAIMDGTAKSLVVNITGGGTAVMQNVWYSVYTGVDQAATPVSQNYNNGGTAGTAAAFGTALSTPAGYKAVLVGAAARATVAVTVTTPTNWTTDDNQVSGTTGRGIVGTFNGATTTTTAPYTFTSTRWSQTGLSLAPAKQFRSNATSFNWGTAASWQESTDGGTNWVTGTTVPTSADGLVTIRNGHTVTVAANATASGLTIESGGTLATSSTFTLGVTGVTSVTGTFTLAGTGTKTFTGEVDINAGGVWNETGISAYSFAGNFVNDATTFTANTGVHTFSGAAKTFSGGTTTSIGSVAVTGTYTNNGTLTVGTALSGAGTLANTSTLNTGGSVSTTTLSNSGTMNVTGSGAISTVTANFTNTGTLNLGGSGTIAGITNNAAGIVNLASSGTITAFNNATSTSTLNISTTPTVPTITTLTVSTAGNTVNYSGAGAQTVKDVAYSNLTTSGSGTKTWTLGAARVVGSNLLVGDATTLSVAGAFAFTVTGTTTVGAGTSGTLSITNATGTKTFTGAVTINNGASLTETAAAQLAFGSNVTINTGGTITENGAAVVGIAGSLVNNGTYTTSSGVHTFSGATKTLSGSATNSIASVAVTGTYTNNGTLTVGTALSGAGTLTNSSTGTLNVNGTCSVTTLTNNGDVTSTGTGAITSTTITNNLNWNMDGTGTVTAFTNAANGVLSISATPTIPTFTALTTSAAGNTVDYDGLGAQTVRVNTYSNLILRGSGAKTIGTAASGTLTSGNLSIAPTGSATASVTNTNISVGSLTLGGVGTIIGTWGAVAATSATNKTDIFFTTGITGYVSVGSDTRTTPTVNITGNTTPYTYTGSAQGPSAATNTGTGTSYSFSYANSGGTTYGPSATAPTNAGSYTVTVTVSANGNYAAASSSATAFSIAAKALTVTGATTANKAYDGTNTATVTGGTLVGIVGSDVVTLTQSGTFAQTGVGTGITITSTSTLGGANAGNYSLTQPGLTARDITAASLTIIANNGSKTYGQTFTTGAGSANFTSSGLQNSETITSITIASTGAVNTAAVGTYTIVPSAATGGTFTASNYNISYTNGTLTVGRAALTITAVNQPVIYGTAAATVTGAGTYTPTGFVNGETSAVIGGSATYTTTYTATTAAATAGVTITPVITALTATNYSFTAANGTITVSEATLTITGLTADNKTYDGTTAATFSGTEAYSGLQNGESFTVSGTPSASFATAAVGNGKTVTFSGYTAPSSNYTVTQPTTTANITAAALTITAENVVKASLATLTSGTGNTAFTVTGLVNNETVGSVTMTYGAAGLAGAAVGTYSNQATPSVATGGTFIVGNYTISYVSGTILVGNARYSVATGNWNATSTWAATSNGMAGATAPVAGDLVFIERNFTVTVTANAACGSLQVGGAGNGQAGTLTMSTNISLSVSGNLTVGGYGNANRTGTINFASGSSINANNLFLGGTGTTPALGTITMTSGGTLTLNGDITLNTAVTNVWTPGLGTLVLANTTTLPSTIFTGFNNLTINSGATVTSGRSFSVGGTMTVNGSFVPGATTHVISGAGTLTGSGSVDVTLVSTTALTSQYTITTRTLTNLTVDYAAAGNQSMFAGTYGAIKTSGSGTKTLLGITTINNNITIGSGTTLNAASFTSAIKGDWGNNGTFTPSTSTIQFTGTAAQNILGTSSSTFNNLTINNSTGVSLSGSIDATVNGTLTLTSGLVTPNANSFTVGSAGTISGASSTSYINGALNRVITVTSATSFPVGKGGNYRPVTFTYAATPGTKTVKIEQFESSSPLSISTASTARFGSRYWNVTQSAIGVAYTVGLNNSGLTPTGTAVMLRREGTGSTSQNATTFSTPTYTNSSSFSTTDISNEVMLAETSIPLTVTGLTGVNKVYDGNTNATATGTAALSGVVSGDDVTLSGTPTFTFTSANVGTAISISTTGYTLTGANSGCYTLTQPTLSANITIATPTVTVTVGTYTYNGSAQGPTAATNTGTGTSYTFSYVGTGSTTYAASSTLPTAAGTYTAAATVAADGNFGSSSSSATAFTIGVATPTVTVTVGTYTYNGSAQGPTVATNTGTGTSYTFSYVGTGSTTYAASSTLPTAAGTYTATATVAANGNYGSASSAATAFTIGKVALTITAAAQTVSYGTAATTVTGNGTYTPTGFVNSETSSVIGGSATYTTTYTATTAAATASVTITPVLTSLTATNYSFSAANGAITVGKASSTLTVTATGPTKTYGTALTAGTSTTNFSVTGTLVGSEALTSVTLTPDAAGLSATTAATTAYVVTPSLATGTGGFLASNYNITYTAYNGIVAFQTQFRSLQTGNWNATATWQQSTDGGTTFGTASTTPTSADGLVTIQNGHTVTLTANATVSDLTIASGGTLNTGATFTLGVTGVTSVTGTFTLAGTGAKTFTGDVDINAGGVWNETGVSTYSFAGNFINDATTFTANTGVHTFSGAAKTLSGGTTSIGSVAVTGSYTNNGTLTVGTSLAGAGGLTQGASAVLNIGGTSGITTLTASATGNTVNYTGAAQTIKSVTYQNLTLSGSGTKTAGAILTIGGNFTLESGTTFAAGAFTHNVAGNWINNGASFTNTGSTINMNGTAAQNIGGTSATTFGGLTINNTAGVILSGTDATVSDALTFTSGLLTTGANKLILTTTASSTGAGAGKYVVGNLQRNISDGSSPSATFDVGDATAFAPVTVAFAGTTSGSGSLVVNTIGTEHPQILTSGIVATKSVNRYWTITNNGVGGFTSYSPTFTFVAGDLDAGATTSNFVVKKFDNPAWSSVTTGTQAATTTQATGLTTFSDFAIGEQEDLSVATQPVNVTICSAGDASFTSTSTSIPTTTIQWQRKIGVGSFQNITGSGFDAGTNYSGYTTETLSLAGSTASVTGYIYRAVFTNVNGSVTSNEVTLTVQNVVTAGAISYPGGTTHLCEGSDPVAFTSTTAGTGDVLTYKWQSSVSPFSVWDNISGATAATYDVPAGISVTTQYRRISVSTVNTVVCESAPTSTVEIIIDQAPTTALAGIDQTDAGTCRLVSVTLAGNTPSVGTGVWSVVGDPSGSSFSDINSGTSTFSGTVGTPYTLRWTVTNSGSVCDPSSDDVNITLNPSTVAYAGIDKTICNTTLTTALAGNASVLPGEVGTWSITSGPDLSTSQFSNVNLATSNFTQTASGNYVLTWTLANGVCSSSSNTNFLVKALASTSVAGPAQAICSSGTALLAANVPVNGIGTWSVFSGPYLSANQFSSTAVPTAVFTPGGGPGVYRLRWSISNSPCAAKVSYVNITVGDPNVSNFAVAGATTIIGESAIVTVTSSSLAAGSYTVTYNMAAGTDNTAVSGTAALVMSAGSGRFTTGILASAGADNKITITSILSATSGCPTILNVTSASFTTQVAATVTAVASSGWNTTTTWDCGCIPGSLNNVVIPNGFTVTGDIGSVPSNSVLNLTIETGGGLTDAVGVITNVLGDLTLNGTISGAGTLNLNGSNKVLGGSGSSAKTTLVSINGNRTIATGANLTFGAGVLINGSFTVTNQGTFNVTGNITGKTLASVWTNDVSSYLKVVGTIFPTANTGTLNTSALNNTVEFAGLAAITLPIPSTQSGYPTFHHLVIAGASGIKTLPATTTAVNGNLTIASSVLSANAVTRILRLRGDWINQVAAGFTESSGTVILDGTGEQTITNSASSVETFTNLKVEKPSGTLNLASNVVVGSTVLSTLTMTSGNINTGAFALTLGYGTGSNAAIYAGILNYTSGVVIGKFKRFIFRLTASGTNILFPVGTSTEYRPASLSLTSAPTISGSITAEFKSTDPGRVNLPISNVSGVTINSRFSEGYWSLVPATTNFTSNFNLTLTATDFISRTLDNDSRIMVRNSGILGWTSPIPGTHGVTSGNDISRTGLSLSTASGGREFGVGHASNCPTPIALVIDGPAEVCANATGEVYSVDYTLGSTYTWTITGTGATQASGTNTNSITVDWGATGGVVSVIEKDACDVNGTLVTLNVNTIVPVAPTAIVGKLNVPENGPTAVVYSITKLPDYSYTWDVTGAVSFTVLSDSSISVLWGAHPTVTSSSISVRSVNSCGPSTSFDQNINVYVVLVSTTSGNWDETASWQNCIANPSTPTVCDIGETDNVLILSGDEILVNVLGARVNNLTIDAGGVLKTGDGIGTFNIYGELTVDGTLGEQSSSAVADIHLLLDAGNLATPTLDGSGVIANSATLYIDESRDIVNTASITKTTGDVQLANGILVTNHGDVTLGGNLIGANATSRWTNAARSYLTISGSLLSTGVLNSLAIGNTVHYNGSSSQDIKRSFTDTYRNIRFSGAGVKSPLADLNVSGNWQNDGSGFLAVANKVSFKGITVMSGATPTNFFGVELNGTSLTFPASQVNIAENLEIISGNFLHGGGILNFNGNSSILYSTSAPQFNTISVASSSILTSPADLRVAGNFINNGTFNANSGLVTFNGTSTISGSVNTTFNNVTVAAASTLNAAPMTVAALTNFGIYNQTGSGTVAVSTLNNKAGATLTLGTGTLNIAGTFTNEGTYTQSAGGGVALSGDLVNSGTLNQTNGSITFAGTTTVSGSGTTSFKDVILNGTSLTLPAGTINVAGDLTFTAGSFNHGNGIINFNGTSSILPVGTTSLFYGISIAATSSLTPPTLLKVAGGFMNNGTFTHNDRTVEFNGSLAQNVNGTSPTTFYNVSISNAGGGVTIATTQNIANTLELGSASKIDVGNGLLTLLSTSETQAASVGVIPSNATFNGNLIVQRFMSRINSVNRSIASPVTGALVSDLADDFSTAYFRSYNETVSGLNTGYYYTGSTAPLVSGKGYYGWNAFGTMDVTGPLTLGSSRGDVAIPVTYTPTIPTASSDDGWNYVGNPYPSAINWNATDWSSANIDPVVYVVDLRANVFRTYSRTTSLGDLPGGNIALGEAFWVRATASNPQLTVKESAKRNTASTYYRMGKVESPTLKISLSNGDVTDNAFLFLAPETSGRYDSNIDAIKREGDLMGISLVSEDNIMLVHYGTNQIGETDIPLNIMASEVGKYSIDFTATGSTTGFEGLFLKDAYTHSAHPISSGAYEFAITQNNASKAGRFYLSKNSDMSDHKEVTLSFYPNPASDWTTMEVNAAQDVAVSMFNVTGIEVMSATIKSQKGIAQGSIDLSGLAPGLYLAKCVVDGRIVVTRIVKK